MGGSLCLDGAAVAKAEYAVTTSDGVRLVLVRGAAPAGAAPRREHPVLLVPGLASGADATFDVAPGRSLFDHLARLGYDVWRVDLRGNGRSGAPDARAWAPGWTVDDHLFKDLPAAVALVLEESGAGQLHWIGEFGWWWCVRACVGVEWGGGAGKERAGGRERERERAAEAHAELGDAPIQPHHQTQPAHAGKHQHQQTKPGHSMGGMLATGALSLQGYLSRHIRSVTMLGSGCYGAGSFHSYVRPLLLALCLYGFPGGFAGGLVGKLVGTWASAGLWPVETLFYWTSNTEVRGRGGAGG